MRTGSVSGASFDGRNHVIPTESLIKGGRDAMYYCDVVSVDEWGEDRGGDECEIGIHRQGSAAEDYRR